MGPSKRCILKELASRVHSVQLAAGTFSDRKQRYKQKYDFVPDHSQLHRKFVKRYKWIDEQLVRTISKLSMFTLTTTLSVPRDICIEPGAPGSSEY
jgi:hypothetical protein